MKDLKDNEETKLGISSQYDINRGKCGNTSKENKLASNGSITFKEH